MSDLRQRTRYEPSEVEPTITQRWLDSGLFSPKADGAAGDSYSIAIPPPNVTGALHMGHALNGSIQDTLVRLHRMRGAKTKWILGTDHAGIATQRQVEKRLEGEGASREAIGREEFLRRVWEWREEFGGTIIEQFTRLGASCDYADERFTMDESYVQAVLKVFVELYDEGLIYRDYYLVNWDPGLKTAVSDLEVEEREGIIDTLYSIAYPLADGDGEVVVATVRPETMLADVAVAVHPDDERYRHLIGKEVVLPIVGRRLPIIGDEYVKTDFGTGCLKITPGHDPNDFEIGRKHKLPELSVIGEDGLMTEEAGPDFAGLTVADAQAAVVARLDAEGLLRARDEYVHTVPFSQRSGARIEPLISQQWFMDMRGLAQPAIDAVRDGKVRIHPESQSRRYLEWLENIRPWCISRQLWWGHQIPVWYRGEGAAAETHVGAEAPAGEGWTRDPDVLDTWFSSALWPFATLGWPEDTADLQAFYPTNVLSTARDILFLWVARMVMMGLRFPGQIPFEDVYVHSVIQAPDGRRMSKSLGTGINPLDLIDGGPRPDVFPQGGDFPAYGADAVRFGLLAMSSTQDVRFSEEKIEQGRALANKLFNATRFVLLQVPDDAAAAPRPRSIEDRWMLARLEQAKADFAARIDAFDFAKAALGLYEFVFDELCDWYVEMVKPRLYSDDDPAGRDDLVATLLHVISQTLALTHPVIPFVTEELWSGLPSAVRGPHDLLAGAPAPTPDPSGRDDDAKHAVGDAIAAICAVRGWRDHVGVKAGAVLDARLPARYEQTAHLIVGLARLHAVSSSDADAVAAVAVAGGAIELLASDAIDLSAARARLDAERDRLSSEIARAEGKLRNERFVSKAPESVVQEERDKLARLHAALAGLEEQ